jgi:hypothetical protein
VGVSWSLSSTAFTESLVDLENVDWLLTQALSGLATSYLLLGNNPDALDAANRCLEIHQRHTKRFLVAHRAT